MDARPKWSARVPASGSRRPGLGPPPGSAASSAAPGWSLRRRRCAGRAPFASVAYERVRAEAGTQFDPAIVRVLERGVSSGDIDLDEPAGAQTDPGLPRRFARDGLVGFPP